MRILYITNGFPYPLTSGYLRHYFLIRELSRRHSVTLLSLVKNDYRAEHAEAMCPFVEELRTFPLVARASGKLGRVLQDARYVLAAEPAVREMSRIAALLHQREGFDAVLVSGKQTVPALRGLPGVPVVADVCDAASIRAAGRAAHVSWWLRPRLHAAAAYLRQVERRLVHSVDRTLFASPRDRDAVLTENDPAGIVVPNGVDLDYWQRTNRTLGANTVVFTGNLRYAPNADAALHLATQIFPLVRKAVPDAELLLVGRDPLPELREAAQRCEGITVTGFVDDVRPYLERAALFAAPLRFGAGIQNKVLEALAMELPVVASRVAAEGLHTVDGQRPPVEIASQPNDFARAIVTLLARGNAPATEGRAYVERNFSWERSGDLVEQALAAAAGSRCIVSAALSTVPTSAF